MNRQTARGREGLMATRQQGAISRLAEQVGDGAEEDQVIVGWPDGGVQVAGDDVEPGSEVGRGDGLAGYGCEFGQFEDVGLKMRVEPGEGDGVGSGAAAEIEDAAGGFACVEGGSDGGSPAGGAQALHRQVGFVGGGGQAAELFGRGEAPDASGEMGPSVPAVHIVEEGRAVSRVG